MTLKKTGKILFLIIFSVSSIVCGAQSGTQSVKVEINAAETHPISPWIYGVCYLNENFDERLHGNLAAIQSEGPVQSSYNWEINASNAGDGWYYMSNNALVYDLPEDQQLVRGKGISRTVSLAQSLEAAALIQVSMLDYVAADTAGYIADSEWAQKPGLATYKHWNINLPRSGNPSGVPDLNDKYVYQDQFVYTIEKMFPESSRTAPVFYTLDCEPGIWPEIHPEIHSWKTTYAELISKTIEYSSMIKDINPDALVFGPDSYGWSGFASLQDAPDAGLPEHTGPDGSWDFLDYYLETLKKEEAEKGRRLVDVLEIHWYPAADFTADMPPVWSVTGENGLSDREIQVIVQRPRSYWDPDYHEDTWIGTWFDPYQDLPGVQLIPRMMQKIEEHYPGTMLAVSEYSNGGSAHIAGGIAQADVLGIFGRECVFEAAIFENLVPLDDPSSFTGGAFACYRNYDGNGSMVGDLSASVFNSDTVNTSVYAMLSSEDHGKMWIVAINKTAKEIRAEISFTGGENFKYCGIFQLTSVSADPRYIKSLKISGDSMEYLMPGYSVSVLELSI